MSTFSDYITRVERRLAQLASPGAQVYAEEVILEHLISAFTVAFDDFDWPDYCKWVTADLDGVTGVVTLDMQSLGLVRFEDIVCIIPKDGNRQALRRPNSMLPPDTLTGNTPMFYDSVLLSRPDKVFKVLPPEASGTLYIRYKCWPNNIDIDTPIYMDPELMISAATFLYLQDDGSNPGAIETARAKYMSRNSKIAEQLSPIIDLSGSPRGPVTWWTEAP